MPFYLSLCSELQLNSYTVKSVKIAAICSSPSPNGNTAVLVNEAVTAAESLGAQIERIDLRDANLQYCQGCLTCLRVGVCPLNDDFEHVKDTILAANGIIIGSPTYGVAPNALMKNFLDRFGIYNAYRSSLGGKYIVSISTAGQIGAKKVTKDLAHLVYGVFQNGAITGTLAVSRGWKRIEEYPQALARAHELGLKLVNDIQTKKKYRLQNLQGKILNHFIVRRVFTKNILDHKDDGMKAVYENLVQREILLTH